MLLVVFTDDLAFSLCIEPLRLLWTRVEHFPNVPRIARGKSTAISCVRVNWSIETGSGVNVTRHLADCQFQVLQKTIILEWIVWGENVSRWYNFLPRWNNVEIVILKRLVVCPSRQKRETRQSNKRKQREKRMRFQLHGCHYVLNWVNEMIRNQSICSSTSLWRTASLKRE